jgi:hypothetical protein
METTERKPQSNNHPWRRKPTARMKYTVRVWSENVRCIDEPTLIVPGVEYGTVRERFYAQVETKGFPCFLGRSDKSTMDAVRDLVFRCNNGGSESVKICMDDLILDFKDRR